MSLDHFRKPSQPAAGTTGHQEDGWCDGYTLPHPVWSEEELNSVQITHTPPEKPVDTAAYYSVQMLRTGFDLLSGYSWGKRFGTLDEKMWLSRIIYLETVAGVPGMIGAMVRHLKSLRRMTRDHGWIHTLLEEAENERMHLLTAMELRRPGPLFKIAVIGTQGLFVSMFWIAYFLSPRFCHKFVGYLEEEAVKTYTHCIESLDKGELKMWENTKAPQIAVCYWRLPGDAMMRDVLLAIRADEGHHREVNHTLGSMRPSETNPFSWSMTSHHQYT
ncbi:Alternative oxidase, mitochondrial [Geodia barretti]|uniref:Alternative oxidase, mitochondrial n=1 Tax=Geodia barretti TaxID=519541 RepID=A0AA35S0Z2_GEOBA|nr:Alternative oxidase, mitochondrial [Geodia barretti]